MGRDPEVEAILKTIREAQEPRELTPAEAEALKAAMARPAHNVVYDLLFMGVYPAKARPAMKLGTLQHLYIEVDAVEEAMENALGRQEFDDLNKLRAELLGQIKELEKELR